MAPTEDDDELLREHLHCCVWSDRKPDFTEVKARVAELLASYQEKFSDDVDE